MFPLTPDQHHWLEVATEDEGWCSFTSCTPSRSRARTRMTRVTATRKRLKMTGAKTQPCLTPIKMSNGSDSWPPTVTLADMPLWKARSILRKCGGQPNLLKTFHKRSLLTVSKRHGHGQWVTQADRWRLKMRSLWNVDMEKNGNDELDETLTRMHVLRRDGVYYTKS